MQTLLTFAFLLLALLSIFPSLSLIMGDEFPLLGALGLYASDVKGDGMYPSFSPQHLPPALPYLTFSQYVLTRGLFFLQAIVSSMPYPISSMATRRSIMPSVPRQPST